MNKTEKIMLGLVAAAALVLSAGVVYGVSGQLQNHQAGYGGGMMAGGYSGRMMGNGYSGGMMGGPYFHGMAGGPTYLNGMMGESQGMMNQMAQYMGAIWNTADATNVGRSVDYVAIVGGAFYPTNLTVAAGTTVTWINMDFVQHTVTSGSEGAQTGLFDSHAMGHMQAFSYTFTTPGTYQYYCDIHPNMVGTVTVVA